MRELSVSAVPEPEKELDLVDAAAQVSAWCGEPLLYDGDDPAMTLAPGTARRRALDAALAEIAEGRDAPSPGWRFRFSLMLGLERVLAADQPALLNGLTLRPHQVDALAGMLAALTAGEERDADLEEDENGGDELAGDAAEDEDGGESGGGDADEDDEDDEDDDADEDDDDADDDDEDDDEDDADEGDAEDGDVDAESVPPVPEEPRIRSAPAARRRARRTRPRSPRSPRSTIRARCAATASSTRPPRARRSRPRASSRPAARSAC